MESLPENKAGQHCCYGVIQSQNSVQLKQAIKEYNDPGELTANDSSARFEDDPALETVEGGKVSIVGIRNAQAAYFKGDVDKIGGTKVAP